MDFGSKAIFTTVSYILQERERERATQGRDAVPFPRGVEGRALVRGDPSGALPCSQDAWVGGHFTRPPGLFPPSSAPGLCYIFALHELRFIYFVECLDGCGIASH